MAYSEGTIVRTTNKCKEYLSDLIGVWEQIIRVTDGYTIRYINPKTQELHEEYVYTYEIIADTLSDQ